MNSEHKIIQSLQFLLEKGRKIKTNITKNSIEGLENICIAVYQILDDVHTSIGIYIYFYFIFHII